jgi:hypothetical protein
VCGGRARLRCCTDICNTGRFDQIDRACASVCVRFVCGRGAQLRRAQPQPVIDPNSANIKIRGTGGQMREIFGGVLAGVGFAWLRAEWSWVDDVCKGCSNNDWPTEIAMIRSLTALAVLKLLPLLAWWVYFAPQRCNFDGGALRTELALFGSSGTRPRPGIDIAAQQIRPICGFHTSFGVSKRNQIK